MASVVDRLDAQIQTSPGCWQWTGSLTRGGYGSFAIDGVNTTAHRAVYLVTVGPIPSGFHLDHLCRNRACVNPDHLEPVTPRENLLRGKGFAAVNSVKTQCPAGHPYSGALPSGKRICKTCRVQATRNWRSRNPS